MSLKPVSIAIITHDRQDRKVPRKNYIFETIDNLKRSGTFESDLFHSLHIFDDCSPEQHIKNLLTYTKDLPKTTVHTFNERGGSRFNAARAHEFMYSINSDVDWGMILEDDLDFCKNFLDSSYQWLRDVAHKNYRVYSLALSGGRSEVSPGGFWGSQGYYMRTRDSLSFCTFLHNPKLGDKTNGHDTKLARWMKETLRKDQQKIFAPSPSLIQHIGLESDIQGSKRDKPHPHFDFIGRDKSYKDI